MSDVPQGPGWWQASDDKWYPPPRPPMPGEEEGAPVGAQPDPGFAAPGAMGPPGAPPAAPGTSPYGTPSFPPSGAPAGPPGVPGPYGVPSGAPAAPGGGGQANHTPLIIAGFVAVAALIVVAALILTGGDDDEGGRTDLSGPDVSSSTPGPVDSITVPPGSTGGDTGGETGSGSDLVVDDSGFSTYRDYNNELKVTYGAQLTNNGDADLTNLSLSVSVLDGSGGPLATSSVSLGLVRAGETVYVGEELFDTLSAEPGSVEIQVSEPTPPLDPVPEGEITTSDVSVTSDEYETTANFAFQSTYAEQIDTPSAYAVFRNDAGEIVGGAANVLDFAPANGSSTGSTSAYAQIEGATSADVWVGPMYL